MGRILSMNFKFSWVQMGTRRPVLDWNPPLAGSTTDAWYQRLIIRWSIMPFFTKWYNFLLSKRRKKSNHYLIFIQQQPTTVKLSISENKQMEHCNMEEKWFWLKFKKQIVIVLTEINSNEHPQFSAKYKFHIAEPKDSNIIFGSSLPMVSQCLSSWKTVNLQLSCLWETLKQNNLQVLVIGQLQ